jgi:hypothetical protein
VLTTEGTTCTGAKPADLGPSAFSRPLITPLRTNLLRTQYQGLIGRPFCRQYLAKLTPSCCACRKFSRYSGLLG